MGDFVYKGEHSITFDPDGIPEPYNKYSKGLNINTWKSWHMAPKTRPFVVAPQVKTEYIDVPGADGSLDYTEALTGKPRYANRTGQWDFIIDNGYRKWHELYSEILLRLHGKKMPIILDDDPNYFWIGRLSVTGNFGNKDFSSVTIQYNLDPYKRPLDSATISNWKWNDLFSNYIRFGNFTVNAFKTHTITNDEGKIVKCNINTTTTIDVYRIDTNADLVLILRDNFDPTLYHPTRLTTGDNEFELLPGKNMLIFKGYGIVKVEYAGGAIL